MLSPKIPEIRVTIPRWTIQRDPVFRHCRRCGSIIVRVRLDSRRISFCTCHIVVDELTSRKARP
ncbi:MAG: hypothetical protein V3S25_01415 [Nitrospirales bacterium]|jgi:hypothetical protein